MEGEYPIPGLDGWYLGYPPVQDWMGYPPPISRLGTPRQGLDGVPLIQDWMGYSPYQEASTCYAGQSENITFRHPSDAGGNERLSELCVTRLAIQMERVKLEVFYDRFNSISSAAN